MDLNRRRSSGNRATPSVVAGSVWESRMKIDEVKGGFKVFNPNAEEIGVDDETNTNTTPTKLKRVQSTNSKRKTWKSDSPQGFERSPILVPTKGKTVDQSVKRTPIQAKRAVRSEPSKDLERSPVGVRKVRTQLFSSPSKPSPNSASKPGVIENAGDKDVGVDEAKAKEQEMSQVEIGSCEIDDDALEDNESDEIEVELVDDEEIEVELVDEETEVDEEKSVEIKEIKEPEEIKAQETKPTKIVSADKVVVSEVKRVNFDNKLELRNHNNTINSNVNSVTKIFHQRQSEPIALNVKRQPPVIKRATIHSSFGAKVGSAPKPHSNSGQYHSFPESHSRLQSFVDLIMWKDISRSVFIFGIGTFTIISSSYTRDLNISFISVISYLGLVYLSAIFLFRSIVCRGVIDMDYTSYVLGEEEAIWLLKLVLPYLNEFLLKLKALFSGDPATTMKLAALLFILARCGSSITIWTMAKLGFFGVFTVPKICSLYSTHITAYATFWVRRFRDVWDSCSHKKGVTIAVFLLVWNLSSIVARIWAVFMLFVAFRYYQQILVNDDWVEDGTEPEETWHEPIGPQNHGPGPTTVDHTKLKKRS